MLGNNLSILIVEDDAIQSKLLELIITKFGHTVCGKASSGKDAIREALALKPNIIIMDIMLSDDIDGIQAASEIQKHVEAEIIYLSGNRDHETLTRASKTKYLAFLGKPYNISDLKKYLSPDSIND